jgi:glutamate racemase
MTQDLSHSAIGIFDSGIGGLTVVREVMQILPNENIIYFGDTARVPYGIKSVDTVKHYAMQITEFLLERKVKMILIACNTVTAAAEAEVKELAGDIPVLGVIEAGAKAALESPQRHHRLAVIGTLATVNSGAYSNTLHSMSSDTDVYSKACSMLVPLAEEGWTDNEIAELTLRSYLDDIKGMNIDALILGCTHYPLFKETIEKVLDNPEVTIIDSAVSIATMAKKELEKRSLLNTSNEPTFECFVSDKPQRFQELAERFLGKKVEQIKVVNLA